MLKRALLLLAVALALTIFPGCQTKIVMADFSDFKNQAVGLEFYELRGSDDKEVQVINLYDKNITRRFLDYLGPLSETKPPEISSFTGKQGYLAFKYFRGNEIISSKQYAYWYCQDAPGYLELEDGWHQVSEEFATHLLNLAQYPDATSEVDPVDVEFLKKFGWTVLYKIKSYTGNLPDSLIHESGEYPVALYYAYNNELSKDIGLDITPYLGKNVVVNLYKIEEPLPPFMESRREANRAVIVKDGVEIIGAWLDAGRPNAFACSLKSNSLEDITGKTWGEWLDQYVNHKNPQEKLISKMEPEEVITTYFEAIDHNDPHTAHACETRKRLISYLFDNMDNNRLYNYSYAINDANWINNIIRAKIIRIKSYKNSQDYSDVKTYMVEVDLNVKRLITHDSGRQVRFITLIRETPLTGWRIDKIATTP